MYNSIFQAIVFVKLHFEVGQTNKGIGKGTAYKKGQRNLKSQAIHSKFFKSFFMVLMHKYETLTSSLLRC